MIPIRHHELPDDLEPVRRRAMRLEWITLAFMGSVVVLMYIVMGSSQAMQTAWIEDLLALIPPIAILIADRVRRRKPNTSFPYGYHRVVTIAFLVGAVAVLGVGLILIYESLAALLKAEHPTIGGVMIGDRMIWQGWLMIVVLLYTMVPAVVLGRLKLDPARRLHDKALHTDAAMNKADWMTALAAILGVVGIGLGLWWADAVAAILISTNVIKDGLSNTKSAIADLMDRRPHQVDESGISAVPDNLKTELRRLEWVRDAAVRLREAGHVYQGEVYLVPADERDPLDRTLQAVKTCYRFDWRIQDVTVQLVHRLDGDP